MCGIYFSNNGETARLDQKFLIRGPDYYNEKFFNNLSMSHSLLSLTGEFTPQPVLKEDVNLIFNGQIYNYDSNKYLSDSYFILDEYIKNPKTFWKNLDGEYAITLHDGKRNKVIFLTDVFGTKPLYYAIEENIITISSLKSSLEENGHKNIIKCKPNAIYSFDLINSKLQIEEEYFKFTLDQYIDSYDDWNDKFLQSIEKRFLNTNHRIILPLSSGHDSGAISLAFDLLGIKYYTYSFFRNEHRKILSRRLLRRFINSPDKTRFKKDLQNQKVRNRIKKHIDQNSDKFFYGSQIENLTINGHEDPGAIGLSYILDKAKSIDSKIKIVASGHGADEVFSNIQNYNFEKPNPKYFTENLKDLFPWQNFYYGTQISYLGKEESIGGSFGLETRYPFLDKSLVQEYLNFKPELKNKYYKAPITNFLMQHNYPFRNDSVKTGFNP